MEELLTNQSQTTEEVTTPEEQPNQAEPIAEETPTEQPETQPELPKIKVKYNHEEKEISYQEAVELAQKGMNYDKVNTKLAERDAEVEKRFGTMGFHTWDDLQKGWDIAQQRQKEQTLDQEYQAVVKKKAEEYSTDPDVLIEIANSLLAKHPTLLKAQELEKENSQFKTKQQMQEQINQSAAEFKAAYPSMDYTTIPQEVYDRCNKGYSLLDSYQIYENKILKEKIAAQEKAIQVKENNQKNAASSPGSVTGNGATSADFISFDTFEKNKGDQRWVIKNLSKIQESRAKWK